MKIEELKFDQKGLIPCVVQDFVTREVLTLAYMNKESLEITMKEGYTCFYSRSRNSLWRKGETSGNRQRVIRITADCDKDALVCLVMKDGPACHTGKESCFFEEFFVGAEGEPFSLQGLYELLVGRKEAPKEGSYTSYLFAKGSEKILKKVGEESTEVVVAAMKQDKDEVIFEISDLCYHILVLMVQMGITPDEVKKELAGRHVVDHKVKQETMK